MKRLRDIAIFLMAILTLASCGKSENPSYSLDIKIKAGDNLQGEEWYLFTYGATQVQVDTVRGKSASFRVKFSRDTTDLFIIMDDAGHYILPILPDSIMKIKVRLGGETEELKGMVDAETLIDWRKHIQALPNGETDKALVQFLDSIASRKVSLPLVMDAILRDKAGKYSSELSSVYRKTASSGAQLKTVMGISPSFESAPITSRDAYFPHFLQNPSMRFEGLTTRNAMGKKNYLAVAILDGQQIEKNMKTAMDKYFSELDSLGTSSYTTIVMADTLPAGWAPRKTAGKLPARYFMVDSIGKASEIASQLRLRSIPSFMVVDTLLHVKQVWSTPDSLINYLRKEQQKTTQK